MPNIEKGGYKNKKSPSRMTGSHFVGVAGFEPATSCSQSRHTNRTVLYPVLKSGAKIDLLFAFAKKYFVLFSAL